MHSLFVREYNEEVDSQPYVCSDILKEYNCDTVEDFQFMDFYQIM